MITIMEMLSLSWEFVEGHARIAHSSRHFSRNGSLYDRLVLRDHTGIMTAYAWANSIVAGPDTYPVGSWIRFRGAVRNYAGRNIINIQVAEIARKQLTGKFYHTIPNIGCQSRGMLRRLHAVTSIIKTPALRDFLDGLFADMSIAIPLLQVPASLRYHHNYRGGLFEHSVECAEIVASIPHLSEKQREVGILAALFHDIGKIKTMTPDLSRTHLGRMVDHASLTTEICSKHLVELEESWPAGSHALRHIWACMSTKYWAYRPSITIVHVVKMADKISCDLAIKLADDVLLQMPNISTTTQHIVQQRQVTS